MGDEVLRRAVLQLLTVIGEAASKMSPSARDHHPEVDWAGAAGFRHRAIHAYFAVSWDIVWVAATEDAPLLARQIAGILARDDGSPEPPGSAKGR